MLAPHLFVLGDQYPELLCVATSKKLILAGIALGVAGKAHQPVLCAVSRRPYRRGAGAVPIPGLFAVGGLLAAVGSHPRVQVKVARYFADTLKALKFDPKNPGAKDGSFEARMAARAQLHEHERTYRER